MRRISWKSIGGVDYRLEIEDGSSAVVDLIGSAEAFVSYVGDDDDVFASVRVSTGMIGIVGEVGDLEGLITGVPAERRVTLYDGDGVCVWRGFLQTAAYSQAWDKGPLALSVPVVSALGVLDSFYLSSDDVADTMSFVEFLSAMNNANGSRFWDEFCFPSVMSASTVLKYRFQKLNYGTWLEDEDRWQMESFAVILEDMCKLFGVCVQECGSRLVFVAPDIICDYDVISAQSMDRGIVGVTSVGTTVVEAEIFGSGHQLDYIDGVKSVEVTGLVNPWEEKLWELNVEKLEVHAWLNSTRDASAGDKTEAYYCIKLRDGAGIETDRSGNFRYENWLKQREYYNGCGCARERLLTGTMGIAGDFFSITEDTGWCDRLMWRAWGRTVGDVLFRIDTSCYVTQSILTYNSYLVLSGSISRASGWNKDFATAWDGELRVNVYVGDVAIALNSPLAIEDGEIRGWRAIVTDIQGQSFSIPSGRSGRVSVEFLVSDTSGNYYSVDSLSLSIAQDWRSNILGVWSKSENRSKRRNDGSGFRGGYSVTCGLTTQKEGQIGRGIVLDSNVESAVPTTLWGGDRPEVVFASRLMDYYAVPRKKVTAVVKCDGRMADVRSLMSVDGFFGRPMCQSTDWGRDETVVTVFEVEG